MSKDFLADRLTAGLDGWKIVTEDSGVGMLRAKMFQELPMDLNSDLLWNEDVAWGEEVLRGILTPTRGVRTKTWLGTGITPIVFIVTPITSVAQDEMRALETYDDVRRFLPPGNEELTVKVRVIDDEDGRNFSLAILNEQENFLATFAFLSFSIKDDSAEVITEVLRPLVQFVSNAISDVSFDVYSSMSKARRSSHELAFEYSLTGSLTGFDTFPFYPAEGLEGWRVLAHNGETESFVSALEAREGESPSDAVAREGVFLFEGVADDDGDIPVGWRSGGMQLFIVPPDAPTGLTPMMIVITLSKYGALHIPSLDYQMYAEHNDLAGLSVIRCAPAPSEFAEGAYDTMYATLSSLGISVSGLVGSVEPETAHYYDAAFDVIAQNVLRTAILLNSVVGGAEQQSSLEEVEED